MFFPSFQGTRRNIHHEYIYTVNSKSLRKFRNQWNKNCHALISQFFSVLDNRLYFLTFGIFFQPNRNIISLSPAVNSEFSFIVKGTKFTTFGIEFITEQEILVIGIFFRNHSNSLNAQTEQNFLPFGIKFTTEPKIWNYGITFTTEPKIWNFGISYLSELNLLLNQKFVISEFPTFRN